MDNLPGLQLFTSNSQSTLNNTSSTQTQKSSNPSYSRSFGSFFSERSAELKTENSLQQHKVREFLLSLWNTNNAPNIQNAEFKINSGSTSPEVFVESILDSAKSAARELGTSAEVVIAFAALETGWGKHIIKNGDGSSSHNLFGIKARVGSDSNNSVNALTNEYIDNKKIRLEQAFRKYDSNADSVADFVTFLKSNPRYQQALEVAHDPSAFIEGIHDAGYATDPNYASKVKALVGNVNAIAEGLNSRSETMPLISLDKSE